jgi:hypothetical protein
MVIQKERNIASMGNNKKGEENVRNYIFLKKKQSKTFLVVTKPFCHSSVIRM